MARAVKQVKTIIDIKPIEMVKVDTFLVGTTPLIMHRFAAKAWRELLLPAAPMNEAAKLENLKHDPLTEFRECVYKNRDNSQPTAVHYPSGAFSKALASAALDMPGAKKAQILRLVSIASTQINIYGVPMLGMDMVRNSDMSRTPDVRTRAYFPEWCCRITIEFVASLLGPTQIVNLLGAAGLIVGIGDYRPQKGGSFGRFSPVTDPDDPVVKRLLRQGRKGQEAALRSPSFFNEDSAELYEWFETEMARREKTAPSRSADPMKMEAPGEWAAAKNAAMKGKATRKRGNGKPVVANP